MRKKNQRILGIDPGSREMGVVILEGDDLIYYAVKTLKQYRPAKELKRAVKEILARLVIEYDVKVLAVENGWFSQSASPLFRTAFEAIAEVAKQRKLTMVTYAPKTIRKFICGDGKATKKRTAQVLAQSYKDLAIYLEQDRRWKEKYWMHCFDALAVGLTHVRKNQEQH